MMKRLLIAAAVTLGLTGQALAVKQVSVNGTSGIVAAATATATLTHVPNQALYLTSFEVSSGAATSAGCVTVTISGLQGGVNLVYSYCVPTLASNQIASQLVVIFPQPIPGVFNGDVTVSMPSVGAGNTSASINVHGYSEAP